MPKATSAHIPDANHSEIAAIGLDNPARTRRCDR